MALPLPVAMDSPVDIRASRIDLRSRVKIFTRASNLLETNPIDTEIEVSSTGKVDRLIWVRSHIRTIIAGVNSN